MKAFLGCEWDFQAISVCQIASLSCGLVTLGVWCDSTGNWKIPKKCFHIYFVCSIKLFCLISGMSQSQDKITQCHASDALIYGCQVKLSVTGIWLAKATSVTIICFEILPFDLYLSCGVAFWIFKSCRRVDSGLRKSSKMLAGFAGSLITSHFNFSLGQPHKRAVKKCKTSDPIHFSRRPIDRRLAEKSETWLVSRAIKFLLP